MSAVVDRASPNHGPRPSGSPIDILLLHYTDMARAEDAVDRLCDPAARVSAHYVVAEDGRVWRLVPESQRAWHAGVSWWAGESDVNGRSIGIEVANHGHSHGYRPFPPPQMAALERLCQGILSRHPIPPDRVLGHSDVAPGRKIDPGHLFDWRGLAGRGIGFWPSETGAAALSDGAVAATLATIGYRIDPGDPYGPVTRAALWSFRRHWCPEGLDRPFDARMSAMLKAVAEGIKKTRKSRCAQGG